MRDTHRISNSSNNKQEKDSDSDSVTNHSNTNSHDKDHSSGTAKKPLNRRSSDFDLVCVFPLQMITFLGSLEYLVTRNNV